MRSVAQIVLGNAAVSGIQMLTGFLMARWILPLEMGIWNTVQIAAVYTPFLTLGIFTGLGRELPYLIGKGRNEEARHFASAAYGWAFALAAITVPAVLGVAGLFAFRGEWRLAAAVLAAGTTIVLTWGTSYLGTTYRTHSEFGRLSAYNTFVAGAGLVLMTLVWAAGFAGMLIRSVISTALGIAALYHKRPMPVHPRWDPPTLLSLAKTGVPIYLLNQLWEFQWALDRMVLVRHTEALGYFTLAITAGSAARMIPNAFASVLYPRLAQSYGEKGRALPLWSVALKGSLAAAGLGAVAGAIGWLAMPFFVRWLLPNYVPGVASAQWACLLGATTGLSVVNNIFNVLKRQDLYLIGWVLGMLSFWGAWEFLGHWTTFEPVTAASIAMVTSTLIASVVAVGTSRWACRQHDRRHLTA